MQEKSYDVYLSVVLPAYNDERGICRVVDSLIEYIRPAVRQLEVIIVEDCSRDNTASVCASLSKQHKEVILICHQKNMGYGRTLRDGFSAATGELVFYTDGDNQYDIKELLVALEVFRKNNADAVFGFRHPRQDGIIRIIISKIYNLLFMVLFYVNVKDVNCSFKLIKNNVIRKLNLNSKSAFIDAEMGFKLKKNKYKIQQIPVSNFPNKFRKSNFVNPNLTLVMLHEMFKERLYIH